MCKKRIYLMAAFFVLGLALSSVVNAADIVARAWEFDADLEGWGLGNNVSDLTWEAGGYMNGTATNGDPYLNSPAGLALDITDAAFIKVRLKNDTPSDRGQIYFATPAGGFAEARRINFTIIPNDTDYTEYTIDMSDHDQWTGTLNRIRLYPATRADPLTVDYFRI